MDTLLAAVVAIEFINVNVLEELDAIRVFVDSRNPAPVEESTLAGPISPGGPIPSIGGVSHPLEAACWIP